MFAKAKIVLAQMHSFERNFFIFSTKIGTVLSWTISRRDFSDIYTIFFIPNIAIFPKECIAHRRISSLKGFSLMTSTTIPTPPLV